MNRPEKKFDCVALKHTIQEKIYEETKNLTWREERARFRKDIQASPLAQKWREIVEQREKRLKKTG